MSQEEVKTLYTDLKAIAVEAGVQRTRTLSQELRQNIETLIADLKASIDSPPDQDLVDDLRMTLKDAFSDRTVTTEELKAIAADVIEVVASTGITTKEARTIFYDLQNIANTSQLPRTHDDITGTQDNDILWGGLGNDTLAGAGASGGVGEADWLTGGGGKDRFVLGNEQQAFYDDGKAFTAGALDFAAILDFNENQDVIQLHGSAEAYQLTTLSSDGDLGASGTGIYRMDNGNTPELIGAIVGVTLTDMSSGFVFV